MISEQELEEYLVAWGAWARKWGDGGQGYPSESPLAEAARYGTTLPRAKGPRIAPVNEEAERVESLWRLLVNHEPPVGEALKLKYVFRMSGREAARALDANETAVRAYLDRGRWWFRGALDQQLAERA